MKRRLVPTVREIDVSVIIPAWRAAGFIQRAVSSALASRGVEVEVIVVDDASPDATFDVIKALAAADERVIASRLAVNSGPSAARNRAIEFARGRYIAILDADDTMRPDRLATLVRIADVSGADVVVDNMQEVDEAGKQIGTRPFIRSEQFKDLRPIDLATWVRFNQPMKPGDCLGYLKPLIRRSKLAETDIVYDTALRNSEDYYLIASLLAEGALMTYTPAPLYHYQRASSSISHRLKPAQTRAWLDAENRFRTRYDGRLAGEAKSALNRRRTALRDVNQFVAAIDALKAKKLVSVAGLMVSDLHATGYTLGTLAKIAMGKALRRKMV